jgi:hypothetical protein
MVRRCLFWSLAFLVLVGSRPTLAGPITFTGNVQQDFSTQNITGNLNSSPVKVMNSPLDLGEASFIPANGWVSGWAINNVQMTYSSANDTMYVGLAGFKNSSGQSAIFGDADGNGDPGGASKQMAAMGGIDSPNLGGDKSVAIAFAPYNTSNPGVPGTPTLIAGIPSDKSLAGSGIDGFSVAKFNNSTNLLQNSFSPAISGVSGALAFNPSAAHPELEFSISNLSKSGINPSQGFWMEMYAGSGQDVVAGEAGLVWTYVPPFEPQQIPEPATWLVWAGLAGGLAWRRYHSRRASA